jgi:CelD/BcsL family acetyltransferase involved in cellulose biosynthesis
LPQGFGLYDEALFAQGLFVVNIEVMRPRDLTDPLIGRWTQFQTLDSGFDNPFLSPFWAQAVERAQTRPGREDPGLRVAIFNDGAGPDGFFAARARGGAAMPAGAPMSDYQGVIGRRDLAVDPKALVKALGVTRLDFNHMLSSQAAFSPYMRGRDLSWIVDVTGGYDAYERNTRERCGVIKDTDRKRRKVEREVGPCRFTAISQSRTDFAKLIQLKRNQMRETGQTDIFGAGWTLRLVEELFERRDPNFGGALFTLHIGDQLAAAHFHLCGGATVHGWLIAHTPEFERYSPGILLFQDILKWMDGGPFQRLDLGCGGYRFKRELSNVQQETGYGFVGAPSAATLARTVAYSLRQTAEGLPLGPVSRLPGKAMRRLDLLRALR